MAIEVFETFAGRVFNRPNAISAPLSYHSREVFGNEKLDRSHGFIYLLNFFILLTLAKTMPSIQSLTLTYDALNEQGTFSEGDTISGKVTLALLKQVKVNSFFIKATGDANVHWTDGSSNNTNTYSAHKRYFKLKQFLFPETSKDTVLPKGIHVYKFSLNIPQGSVPSSFKGPYGKIVYKLEAKLSRSWRMDLTVEQKILFVSRCYPNLHSMMLPQIGATKKEMGLFSKGQADMEVTIDRMAYAPGETITVLAKINNSSSSEMTPKFRLGKKVIYRASGSTKREESTIIKVVENRIQAHTELEAYLDISFAFDPEVLFPLVVVPLGFAPVPQPGVAAGPYPAGAVGGPSNSDFPPPAVSGHPYPVSPSSGRSGNPGAPMYSAPPPPVYPGNPMVFPCPPSVYPAQPAHVSGAYNNQVPEIPFPYGTPFSSSVIHPPPTAPTFQTPPAAPAIPPAPSLPAINPPLLFHPSMYPQRLHLTHTCRKQSPFYRSKMSPIKYFIVTYEAPNEKGFTVFLKEILSQAQNRIEGAGVKVKGNARVHWTEGTGDRRNSRTAHRRYLKLKEDMPSSFKGYHGKIVYMLEAKMSRSWRPSSVVQSPYICVKVLVTPWLRNGSPVWFSGKGQRKGANRIVYRAEACANVSDLSLYKMEGDTITSGAEELSHAKDMSPKDTKLRALAMPGSTADIKERVNIRSDAMTAPSKRHRTWNQIEKLLKQWQTRGLIPADDQPGPTKAHRKAVVEYENAEYLQQQEAWVKAGQPPWYGPAKSAMKKAEKRQTTVTRLLLHLKYVFETFAGRVFNRPNAISASLIIPFKGSVWKRETMPSIQSLTLIYDALNEQGTFSEGDTISGKVTLALLKQVTVDSFFIKATGDANVHWTTKSGDKTHSHSAHKRYFKLKQFFFPEASKDTVLPQGIHVYKFSLNIPQGGVPSSFKGPYGKIVYKLEAKLSRSWRMDQTVEQKILFVSRCYPNLHSMMLPQIGATKKEMGLFSKGQADMEVTIDRMAYAPGETITVLAKINNSSSSEMTPKFRLGKKVIYRASGSTKREECTIIKVVENRIQAHTELEAYLDISFAFDPEVLFPVVIVPLGFAPVPQPGVAAGPYPAGAVGGPSNSDFPPPAVSGHPYPVSPSSGRSGNPGAPMYSAPPPPVYPGNPMVFPCPPSVYPAQPAHVSGGYNNQVPEIPFPYGTPFSSSVIHPPPTAPTFQTPPAAPAIHRPPSLPVIHPPPSLPEINLPPSYSSFNVSPTAPSYNLGPSAPMMTTDFLGQSDEAPPAYTLLFPSTATDKSVAK
ncbi:hypothetical protein F7725_012742 [Dissostichus mawsoni]|uniref:Arrestin C-terminal-like domain-containing protein n=1 Tax=Dissostichus mawsoni TaxID=36200 RepID=A0A7J5YNJ6_DISMA|nr:hypothetical protein F7725_012742 [Dissostichus mawsoni]